MEYGATDFASAEWPDVCGRRAGSPRAAATDRDEPASLEQVFAARPRMRVLIESSTESEWVAQALERWGHEVVVVDPNYGLMYGQRPRGVQTDRRDAAALAEACRVGGYRRAHRVRQRNGRAGERLRVREQLVRMRTYLITRVRAQLRQEGYRLSSGAAATTLARPRRLELPASLWTDEHRWWRCGRRRGRS